MNDKRLARGVVLCSGSASSFRFVHQHDSNLGKRYEIVGVFSDKLGTKGVAYAKDQGIPTEELDFTTWCEQNGIGLLDLEGRKRYFAEVLQCMAPWQPDFIMLSGFMLLLTDPFLTKFEGLTTNVHPSWLSIQDKNGKRKYRGLKVVERAMASKDPTGSTVHLVTKEPDGGPIVFESKALPYEFGDDPEEHQEKMKTACDGPAFVGALDRLITAGWPHIPWQPTV